MKNVMVYISLELTSKTIFSEYMPQGTVPKQLLYYFCNIQTN